MGPRRSNGTTTRRRRDGFALVIALALMAFVVLLIISLGTVGRIESSRAYTQRQTALARQQAFYALGLALGQLQDAAGPDRRVTARAEILGPGAAAQPLWAGVWDTTGGAGGPTWLVTDDPADGARPDPTAPIGSMVTLVGAGSAGGDPQDWVEVPTMTLQSTNAVGESVDTARIAWWTSDEGVKASIQGLDTVDDLKMPAAESQRIRQAANADVAWRDWFPSDSTVFGPPDDDWKEALSPQQFAAWIDPSGATAMAERFHDLTLNAVGLLTNPLDGGFKLNLNASANGDPIEGSFGDVFGDGRALSVWRAYPPPNADGAVPLTPIDPLTYESVNPGEPFVQIAPVLSECALFVSVFHHAYYNQPGFRYYFDAEFWNPYTRGIVLADGREANDRRVFDISVLGLPEVTLENLNKHVFSDPIEMDRTIRDTDEKRILGSWMEFGRATNGNAPQGTFTLQGGEVYRLEDPDPDTQAYGLANKSGVDFAFEDGDPVVLSGVRPRGINGVRFAVTDRGNHGGGRVFEMANIPYDSFQFHHHAGSIPYEKLSRESVDVENMFVMAFHYRIGSSTDWSDPADWLADFDFRQPSIDYLATWTDREGVANKVSDWVSIANRNPVLVSSNMSGISPGNEILFDRTPRESEWNDYGDVRLYDLPVGDPITVADFRILPYKELPPLSLGSNYTVATNLNRAFDRYFLLPVPLENTRLQRLPVRNGQTGPTTAALAGAHAAEFYALRGAFNWNSTSVAAWYANLVQAFEGDRAWRYTGAANEAGSLDRPAMIFRHPKGAQIRQQPASDAVLKGRDAAARFASFRQGVRLLDRPEVAFAEIEAADDPLYRLAVEIVAALTTRGAPFNSLSDFMNAGLLEDAIAASEINQGILPHAVGYLRQSDLVGLLGLAPAVRSDTFVIRAMGQILNPATGELEGEAWLEARVQRMVEFVDTSRAPADRPGPVDRGPADARRFKIVSFRWLNPADDI